jgi:hypothetical protein
MLKRLLAGSVEIEPTVRLPVGGKDDIAFLFCRSCQSSREINYVPIDQPPWSVAKRVPTTATTVRYAIGAGVFHTSHCATTIPPDHRESAATSKR